MLTVRIVVLVAIAAVMFVIVEGHRAGSARAPLASNSAVASDVVTK